MAAAACLRYPIETVGGPWGSPAVLNCNPLGLKDICMFAESDVSITPSMPFSSI